MEMRSGLAGGGEPRPGVLVAREAAHPRESGRVGLVASSPGAELVRADDYGAREKVRQLVMDTFERIVIYMRGLEPDGRKGRIIDVQLLSRTGQHRLIQIDRCSGEWVSSEDWN